MKKVSRAIILNEKGEVLLGMRIRNKGEGQWALIGGKPDEGESPEDAVVREVAEEIGVIFHPSFFEDRITQLPGEEEPWHLSVFYGPIEGTPVLKEDEVRALQYFSREEIRSMALAFNHCEVLERFFSSEVYISPRPT